MSIQMKLKKYAGPVLVSCLATGCMSLQNHNPLDEAPGFITGAKAKPQPFVEGFFEYPGPREKWVGPKTFSLHLSAKEGDHAEVTVSLGEQERTYNGFTTEKVRGDLEAWEAAVASEKPTFSGCLSPIRVRFVRADGTFTEAQGCRSETGWAGALSHSIDGYLQAMGKGQPDVKIGDIDVAKLKEREPASANSNLPEPERRNQTVK